MHPCGQNDTCKNITFPQLRIRTVITNTFISKSIFNTRMHSSRKCTIRYSDHREEGCIPTCTGQGVCIPAGIGWGRLVCIPTCTGQGGVYPSRHWMGADGVYPSMHWAGGCVPACTGQGVSALGDVCPGVSASGCVCPGECLPRAVSAQGGFFLRGCQVGGCLHMGVSTLGGVCCIPC